MKGDNLMKTITVKELRELMERNKALKVVDIRTPAENRAVRFEGSDNLPVENIMEHLDELKLHERVYVSCNSGNRSKMVCEDLALHGLTNLVNVEGGIQEWIKEGLPVIRTKKWSMPIMQQVMVIAGSLILTGVVASVYLYTHFIFLSGAVGLGLLYAGLSGNCYMTKVLSKMPWNK
ncbi:sulfurtransferase [Candidatus Marinamargulisbacteria bacterium SCGC AAA071-K20]|nr:sulfurtransferase [Candidatus Marinamargulisbacteria bacterium SCGC AAA071-K20]